MSFKQEQKELKRPDELQKLGQQALPWMEQHGRTVVFGVLGVGVLGLIITVSQHLSQRAELSAMAGFGAALTVLDREVNATAAPKEGEEPPFKTENERDDALIAQLSTFRGANAGKKASINAALPLAQALLREGKPADALPLLEEYLRGAEPSDPLRPIALEAKGYAFEAQKKYDEASTAFGQLTSENKTDFLKGMGLYHQARMLELKGELPKAASQYQQVESAAPASSAARLAKDRLGLLAARGVTVAPPPPPAGFSVVDAGG